MIDIRQMRYFVAVAETLHFGRAAERLHVSQPPLSRQIANLERELGVRLLDRHSRRASLTHAGRRFLQDARNVLTAFDEACRNARLADQGELGELSIGFMMHAAQTVLPGLARKFVENHPGVRLELREALPAALADAVVASRVDAGIMFDPGPVRGLAIHRVHEERLCLALPSMHRLAGRDMVGAQELDGEPLIAAPAEVVPTLHAAILAFCRSGGVEPIFRLETQLQQTVVSLVAQGLGVALVPESLGWSGHADVLFRPLEAAPSVTHVVAWRPANLNPALRAFLSIAGVKPASP